jgi:integrase
MLSPEEARAARDAARGLVKAGRDPASALGHLFSRPQKAAGETFELIAREWHAKQIGTWAARHANDVLHSLERDVFPYLGGAAIREITAPEVLAVLSKIEARPAIETAHRVRQRISSVFVYAIASGRGDGDPAAIVEKAHAPVPAPSRKHARSSSASRRHPGDP